MNDSSIACIDENRRLDRIQVRDSIPVLDTGRFEQMQRIATVMAQSSMIPDCLYMIGDKDNKERMPPHVVVSNCFLVVNQSVRWGMDPFAVAQCVSVIHGKICYEGKLIAAVLDAKLGLHLVPEYENEGKGDAMSVTIYAYDQTGKAIANPRNNEPLTVRGSVGEWKTTGSNSPWGSSKSHGRMLMYRGTREWARLYRPAIMLGVYADDEIDETDSSVNTSRRRAPPPPAAVIEQKPIDVKQLNTPQDGQRRAPPPPMAAGVSPTQTEATAADVTDFEAVRKEFSKAAKGAISNEELGAAWDCIVEPHWNSMFPPDQDELLQINRTRSQELPSDD